MMFGRWEFAATTGGRANEVYSSGYISSVVVTVVSGVFVGAVTSPVVAAVWLEAAATSPGGNGDNRDGRRCG